MRTNLTSGVVTKARVRMNDRAAVATTLPIAAALMAAALATAWPLERAVAREAFDGLFSTQVDTSRSCHKVDEVRSSLFPKQLVAAYDFTGDDAGKLRTALDNATEQTAPDASLVRLVLLPDTNEALAFQFGMDGCHTVTASFDFVGMASVFEKAGVSPPFGRTFYQLPSVQI